MEKNPHEPTTHQPSEQENGTWFKFVPSTIDALGRLAKTLDEHPQGIWGIVAIALAFGFSIGWVLFVCHL